MSLKLLSRTCLFSDVDGTMLRDDKAISEKNLAAIAELEAAGGQFVVATGRGILMARPIIEMLKFEGIALLFNGAAVYDFSRREYLWRDELPQVSDVYIREIMREFPLAAIEVLQDDTVWVPRTNPAEDRHIALGQVPAVFGDYDKIPMQNRIKMLAVDEPEVIDKIISFVKDKEMNGTNWVRSDKFFYEMLPPGATKAKGMLEMLKAVPKNNGGADWFTVAMGDYDNDIEMIRQARLGVAVANALPQVREAADLITVSNNDDAVYEVVESIKNLPED